MPYRLGTSARASAGPTLRLVANLIDADLLILLTDQAGLFTADPRRNASATLIPEVPAITDAIVALAAGAGTVRGSGGMATKVQAARLATESGGAANTFLSTPSPAPSRRRDTSSSGASTSAR